MGSVNTFKYKDWSKTENGYDIQSKPSDVWFKAYQRLLVQMANTSEGRDLFCIDKGLPYIYKMKENSVSGIVDIKDGRLTSISDFRTNPKWAKVICHRWPDFVKMAKGFYDFPEFGLTNIDINGEFRLAAATSEFFPDAGSPATNVVDGDIVLNNSADWDTTHNASVGVAVDDTRVTLRIRSGVTGGGNFAIQRAFAGFYNLTDMVGDSIDSATWDGYVTLITNDENDGDDFIGIVQATPASNTALVVGDFDQCGTVDTPTEGATRIDLGSLTASVYNPFTMTATGLGWLETARDGSGIFMSGAREGHDIVDSPIVGGAGTDNIVWFSAADETGTLQDVKVVVTHTAIVAGIVPLRRRIEGC